MSIFKINQLDFQTVTVATNPSRFYSSSSSGVTGSLHIFQRRSSVEKELRPLEGFLESTFDDKDIENSINDIKNAVKSNNDVLNNLKDYLDVDVKNQTVSAKKQKKLDIIRFTPTPVSGSVEGALPNYTYFSKNYLRKSIIKNNLSTYYKSAYPSAHWGYCNYHSLNFFSSSAVSTGSVLIYPNIIQDYVSSTPYTSGIYSLDNKFSFDFRINPRYNSLGEDGHFKAGTIFHLSSSYAVSLITGSKKDVNGFPIGFRLMLQLSHSADIPPSLATPGSYPRDLTFVSEDNSLLWNNWHHAVIRWGGQSVNDGTGSFIIDEINKGNFVIPSGTISPLVFTNTNNPDALCIGNFFEGNNAGANQQKKFFTSLAKKNWGTYELDSDVSVDQPSSFNFDHLLQAELHELCIKNYYVSDAEIAASSSTGPFKNTLTDTKFYLPPFFVERTNVRNNVPWGIKNLNSGSTDTPFNVQLAFGVNGHLINTENFLKEFTNNSFPRQIGFEYNYPSITSGPTKKANDYIYEFQSNKRRNLTILPCDDGKFYPNYQVLDEEYPKDTQRDDNFSFAPGYISLNQMIVTNSPYFGVVNPSEQDIKTLINSLPESPLSVIGPSLQTYSTSLVNASNDDSIRDRQQKFPASDVIRTKDNSSNQVTFFDISNLYYGLNIVPGSFTLYDNALTGSGGAVKIRIKDNGNGTLYRADAETKHCQWNAVGTIFYNEGIIAIKNPHLYFFGKDQFEMSFKGEQNIHTLRFEVVAPANLLNSSSNPTYENIPSTLRPNEYDSKFVYITGINFHDDNLNVVMKTQLAQPIMKRHTDKIAFKVKYDW
jgi:hypothetical protein